MRCLERDKRWVLVSFFVAKVARTDERGRLTGKFDVVRTEPMPVLASVSATKGTAESSPFGTDLDYDRTVVFDDVGFPVDENCVFWVDNWEPGASVAAPGPEEDGGFSGAAPDVPHDYVVKRVAKSPNAIAVAVKRVEVAP